MYGPHTQCVRIGSYVWLRNVQPYEKVVWYFACLNTIIHFSGMWFITQHLKLFWCMMACDASHTSLSLYTLSLVFVYLNLFLYLNFLTMNICDFS